MVRHVISCASIALSLFGLMMLILITAATEVPAKDKPTWIEQLPTSNEYIYVMGIRSGAPTLEAGRSEAARQGVGELTSYLGVRMQSKLEIFMTDLETKVQDEMKATTERVELRGGLIHDWYVERTVQGTYDVYVLLRYPRAEIEKEQARLAKMLAEKSAQALLGMRQAAEAERLGDIIGTLNAYTAVISSAAEAEDERLYIVALGEMSRVVQNLQVRLFSGNGQRVERSKGAIDPLIVKAVLVLGDKEIPVQRLPIRYQFAGDNTLVCESLSNDLGLVSCGVAQLPQASKQSLGKDVIVQAFIETDGMISLPSDLSDRDRKKIQEMLQPLKKRIVEFLLTPFVEKKGTRVVVSIKEENLSKSVAHPLLGDTIASKLVGAGYQVVADREMDKSSRDQLAGVGQMMDGVKISPKLSQMVQMLVIGNCTTRPGVQMPGLDLIPMRADGTVKAIDLSTGHTLAQKSISNVVGFGLTQEQAGIAALQKMSGALAQGFLDELLALTREQGK
jgi:hypothetical protein